MMKKIETAVSVFVASFASAPVLGLNKLSKFFVHKLLHGLFVYMER